MTYDRYLLRSFFHTFGVCFVATFGLVAVIDLFENLDELLKQNGNDGMLALVWMIVKLNGYRSILFLDRAGPSLMIITVMTVLILLQRSGELHPLLAAGIPMYRILRPVIFACVALNGVLMINQETQFRRRVPGTRKSSIKTIRPSSQVESVTDHSTQIWIDGDRVAQPQSPCGLRAPCTHTGQRVHHSGSRDRQVHSRQQKTTRWMAAAERDDSATGRCRSEPDGRRSQTGSDSPRQTRCICRLGDHLRSTLPAKHKLHFLIDARVARSDPVSGIRSGVGPSAGLVCAFAIHAALDQYYCRAIDDTADGSTRKPRPGGRFVTVRVCSGRVVCTHTGFQSMGRHVIPDLAAWGPVVIGGTPGMAVWRHQAGAGRIMKLLWTIEQSQMQFATS